MNYGSHTANLNQLARKLQTITANSGFDRAAVYALVVDMQMEAQAIKDLIQKEHDNARNNAFSTLYPLMADATYLARDKT